MTGNNSPCEEEEEVVWKERGRDRGWANPLLHTPAIIAILMGRRLDLKSSILPSAWTACSEPEFFFFYPDIPILFKKFA
jgi:hypothetical protein